MRKLPPLRALQVFEAAARQQHFSRAADELCITQSAVSHQIRLLEDHLNEPLFHRRGRQLKLTAKGELLFGELERIFNDLSDLTQQISGNTNQEVRLAVYSSFAVKWLIPRLNDFRRQYPHVKIRLEMMTEDPKLSDTVADMFITANVEQRGYWQQRLHTERLIAVCSPELVVQQPAINLTNFHQFALLTVDEGILGLDWSRWFHHNHIERHLGQQQHIFSHVLLAIEAAIAGQGIALASDFMVARDIAAGNLLALELPDLLTGFEFTFCCKQRRLKEPSIASFAKWLSTQVESSA